jgi:glycosyltransferase involved in cell wall biosynthesis
MGTLDILGPGRGALAPPAQAAAFGTALAALLNKPAWRAQLSAEAPLYAAEWSDQAMAGRLASLYQQLLCENPCADELLTASA